jgi:hypothetical protein
MNYEKIILEMLERIKNLEEKVELLEEFRESFANTDEECEETDAVHLGNSGKENDISGKNKSRQEIMKILTNEYGFSVRKANRREGSGLVATKNGKSYGIKVSYSRSYFEYLDEELLCCGWHAVTKKDIENKNVSFYIFVVEGEKKDYHYFIFSREDLYAYCFSQDDSPQKKVHLHFRVNREGMPYEARDGVTDMSAHYNNWKIITD